LENKIQLSYSFFLSYVTIADHLLLILAGGVDRRVFLEDDKAEITTLLRVMIDRKFHFIDL
jgi:hypothetical protein